MYAHYQIELNEGIKMKCFTCQFDVPYNYMIDLELYSARGGPLQLGFVLVLLL